MMMAEDYKFFLNGVFFSLFFHLFHILGAVTPHQAISSAGTLRVTRRFKLKAIACM